MEDDNLLFFPKLNSEKVLTHLTVSKHSYLQYYRYERDPGVREETQKKMGLTTKIGLGQIYLMGWKSVTQVVVTEDF